MIIKDLPNKEILTLIGDSANYLNIECFVVGGYVRNYFLKKTTKDIDIVCNKKGIELAELIAKKLNRKIVIYKNFGTALVKDNNFDIEFITARTESYNQNSRKPHVKLGTMEDDQRRRDFTINAMFIGLDKKNKYKLIDPFGGLNDLNNKIIKTPLDPDKTYSDDPLRMIRAVRFASQLNFKIDDNSLKSIKKNHDRLKIISNERIIEEFNKIILSEKPSNGIKILFETNLLNIFFPELVKLQGKETINNHSHKDNFYHTLQVLDNISKKTNNLWLRWAAILHDIAKPQTKKYDEQNGWSFHGHEFLGSKFVPKIFKRLKLPLNENMKYVQKLVLLHLRPIGLAKENITDSGYRRLIVDAGDEIEDLFTLCISDITSKNEEKVKKYLKNLTNVREKIEKVEEKDQLRNFQPPISGEHIMKYFNIKPSKLVGKIKLEIREAILNGDIKNNFEEAENYMIKIGKKINI